VVQKRSVHVDSRSIVQITMKENIISKARVR